MFSASLLTHTILEVPVHVPAQATEPTRQVYRDWILARLQSQQGAQVVTCNAEMVMMAQQDPQFLTLAQKADLITPDGAGIVWALALQGVRVQRSPGIEIAEDLLAEVAATGHRVALVGGQPQVLAQAAQYWQQRYPQLELWSHHGYFSPEEESAVLASLQHSQAQLVLVGLGSPRQEFWIQLHRGILPNAIWMGVGGSFDIWAGVKQRAPAWWRAHRLEWLYRLYQEPWRWRRMLALPRFAWQVMWRSLSPQIRPTPPSDLNR